MMSTSVLWIRIISSAALRLWRWSLSHVDVQKMCFHISWNDFFFKTVHFLRFQWGLCFSDCFPSANVHDPSPWTSVREIRNAAVDFAGYMLWHDETWNHIRNVEKKTPLELLNDAKFSRLFHSPIAYLDPFRSTRVVTFTQLLEPSFRRPHRISWGSWQSTTAFVPMVQEVSWLWVCLVYQK